MPDQKIVVIIGSLLDRPAMMNQKRNIILREKYSNFSSDPLPVILVPTNLKCTRSVALHMNKIVDGGTFRLEKSAPSACEIRAKGEATEGRHPRESCASVLTGTPPFSFLESCMRTRFKFPRWTLLIFSNIVTIHGHEVNNWFRIPISNVLDSIH